MVKFMEDIENLLSENFRSLNSLMFELAETLGDSVILHYNPLNTEEPWTIHVGEYCLMGETAEELALIMIQIMNGTYNETKSENNI